MHHPTEVLFFIQIRQGMAQILFEAPAFDKPEGGSVLTANAKEILKRAEQFNVKFIRLQFTDILGIIKNVAIPIKQLEKALNNEIMFDGSSIEGYVRVEESDMNLQPDPNTFMIFPWSGGTQTEARLICDVYHTNGQPFPGDPRFVLKTVLQEAAAMGYQVMCGPECEFFLFNLDDEGKGTTATYDEAGYFDMGPVDRGEVARRDIVVALEEMGFDVEASHHEVAIGQHEIGFKYDDALVSADRVATFKFVTKTIARQHGLHATFMPKPQFAQAGSGMHTHLSLIGPDGRNVFYHPEGPFQLSTVARQFIAGLLHHAPAVTAIANPLVNSYKRLVPGYEAPVYVSWSAQNRSALVRVPASRDQGTRVELRSPDPSCNPYLAFAAVIKAGLDGICQGMEAPPSLETNVYEMSRKERSRHGISNLPTSLMDAIQALQADPVISGALGSHIMHQFIRAKEQDWHEYCTQVHPWEVQKYLGVY